MSVGTMPPRRPSRSRPAPRVRAAHCTRSQRPRSCRPRTRTRCG